MRTALTQLAASAMTVSLAVLPIRAAQRLGAAAGWVAWRARTHAASVTRANLQACFPELSAREREDLVRRSLSATGTLIAEFGFVSRARDVRWRAQIRSIVGAELLEEHHEVQGRGTLVLVPHFGNWELLNLYLGRTHALIAMYEPRRLPALDRLVLRSRVRTGSTLVPASAAGVRALYRGLLEGRTVAVLPDQVPARAAGVFAPFFGIPALTMTLPLRLARRTGARVVLGSARRTEEGRFEIRFEDLGDALRDESDVVAATALNRAIEALVARDVTQYQWEYKRFRRLPRGHDRVY